MLGAAVSLGGYLLASGAAGFPLDDSWIHQTLARNLLAQGEWGINPGQPVAVSTAPLWTLSLLPGQAVAGTGLPWAFVLGCLCLAWTGWETGRLAQLLFPEMSWLAIVGMLISLFEWHLVWAAGSGMETLLFTALSLATLRSAMAGGAAWRTGLLAGLLATARPEGVLLGAIVGARHLARRELLPALSLAGCAALMLAPVAALNLFAGGSPLPSTFFAKNAAYATGLTGHLTFFPEALLELARGPLLLLFPGVVCAVMSHSPSPWRFWFPLLWAAGLLVVYGLWLPASYHHGRYFMPLIPILVVYGLAGSAGLVERLKLRLVPIAGGAAMALLLAFAWVRGAQVYTQNVDYVNGAQVALAGWLRDQTPPAAIVASHDIGALGYFAHRRLIDLAGLATPELALSARDVPRILEVVEEQRVSYLAILPDWYLPLYRALQSDGRFADVTPPAKPFQAFTLLEFEP